ncbi:conserved hypothetical protein [Tenacibaculum litopenaei]|uniref:DUF4296 domain-containing protein n=1 Tax=Tenacibaculum litopenaei TaxID=396016 RepID=UPI00389526A1
MNKVSYIAIILLLVSCNSNTIYKEPEGLIPRDSMISLLTDMYLASSAKNIKNKFLKKEANYMIQVYEKYRIDSVRFDLSNQYYTSRIDEYTDMLNVVKKRLDSTRIHYQNLKAAQDSTNAVKPSLKEIKEELRKEEKLSEDSIDQLR